MLGLRNPPHSWTGTVGPSLPGFTIAHVWIPSCAIGRGYHHGALNYDTDLTTSFPSSILHFPLLAPPDLMLCQYLDHFI
jgi:hypothetical protein